MQRIIHATEEDPDKENIMKIWKDYTIESAMDITEKAWGHQAQKVSSCWTKPCPDVVRDCTGFTAEPIKEGMRLRRWQKRKSVGGKGFQDIDLGGILELTDAAPDEFTDDALTEKSAPGPVPGGEEDMEEAQPENTLASDNRQKGADCSRWLLTFLITGILLRSGYWD